MTYSRREFWAVATGVTLLAQEKAKQGMIALSKRPEDLEMPLSGFVDYITPVEHFFVRTHVYEPKVNLAEWKLNIAGEVWRPAALTMDEIKKMPAVEMVAVTECAGNGRIFAEPPVPGLQWSNGSVGNGRWRGVRLADVLKQAGVKDSAKEVLFNGADVPIGTMKDFERSIPIQKAIDPNTLLAYEMNGETLPSKHGFPMRVIVPGWASDSWLKWLTNITVLDKEFDGFWMKSAYRKPDHPIAPGSAMPPEKMVPVTSLRVKSVIASPADGSTLKLGQAVTIYGVAWSGDQGPVTGVEVSTDSGRSWTAAKLGMEKSQFGWRQWSFAFKPEREAYYNVMARAHDASGATQPFAQEWNPSGYGWNVAPRIGINVLENPPEMTATPAMISPGQPTLNTPGQPAGVPPEFKQSCIGCHEDDVIRAQRLTRAQWDREITKMTGWGAQVKDRETILDYLVRTYGPRAR